MSLIDYDAFECDPNCYHYNRISCLHAYVKPCMRKLSYKEFLKKSPCYGCTHLCSYGNDPYFLMCGACKASTCGEDKKYYKSSRGD